MGIDNEEVWALMTKRKPGRPRGIKLHSLHVSVRKEQLEAIKELAKEEGLTISAFIRFLLDEIMSDDLLDELQKG